MFIIIYLVYIKRDLKDAFYNSISKMATQLIIKQFETREITMIQDDDKEVWFKANELCTVLGYSNSRDAIHKHVDLEDKLKMGDIKGVAKWDSYNLQPHTTFINESGVYSLILRSKLESSKQFNRWVTKEVLPAIRKTGTYTLPKKDTGSYIQEAQMIENITHPKIQMLLYDKLANELQGTDSQGPKEYWSRDVVTIVKDELNKSITFSEAAQVGKFIIKKYRAIFNKEPQKYSKFVNGNTRQVFAYTKDEEKHVIKWVNEFYN